MDDVELNCTSARASTLGYRMPDLFMTNSGQPRDNIVFASKCDDERDLSRADERRTIHVVKPLWPASTHGC